MDLAELKNRIYANIKRHPWELARIEVLVSLLKDVLKNEEEFSVLDIGCGDIFPISKLIELYPKVSFYAIDIAFTDKIIEELKDIIEGKNIYLFQTLDEANLHLKKPVNLVLLLDVVEHIKDDNEFLISLNKNIHINKDTFIAITVPAFQSLFCSHDHFLGHYRRYSNKTLLKTINNAGFEKISMGYFFLSLIPLRILQVLKEKIVKPDLTKETTGLVEWNKTSRITNVIKKILLYDFKICNLIKDTTGLSLIGLSNYIICKKRVS